MSWFSRRERAARAFDTGHEGDNELLAQINKRSDLSSPRHWVHYLYTPDRPSAEQAATEIRAGGWHIQALEPDTERDDWGVVAEKPNAVTSPVAVQEARAFFEAVASRVNGEYDGWEASV